MDTITHGIAGALIGKGFFSERYGRVATFALTLGAVFPDSDVVAEIVARDPLAIVKYHRAVTHSFVALPVFAFILALLTLWLLPWVKHRFPRWADSEAPPLWALTLIYGIGIASHILLDGMTSFGTRMWYPFSNKRVAWDLLFIVDFTFTAIVLFPQIVPWVYAPGPPSTKPRSRALKMWLIFSGSTFALWSIMRVAGYPFRLWIAFLICAILAAIFFGPAIRGFGFRVTREAWCVAGVVLMVAYILGCAIAHHNAIVRVKAFADENRIDANRMAALPIPPSLLDWGDAIRSPDGLYEAQFDLRDKDAPAFRFVPDSPPDMYIARAFQLPSVRLYWQFARFPSIQSFQADGHDVVELGENRFSDGRRRSPQPFTWEVVFDQHGNLLQQGWLTEGMFRQRIRRSVPQPPLPPKPMKTKP